MHGRHDRGGKSELKQLTQATSQAGFEDDATTSSLVFFFLIIILREKVQVYSGRLEHYNRRNLSFEAYQPQFFPAPPWCRPSSATVTARLSSSFRRGSAHSSLCFFFWSMLSLLFFGQPCSLFSLFFLV